MKKILITSVFAIFALALPGTASAQAKKTEKAPAKPAETAPDAKPAAPATDAAPAPAAAETKPAAPATDAKPAPPEKPKTEAAKKGVKLQGGYGKVAAVDAEKKTITIGRTVYSFNDETQFLNGEAPAQVTDVTAGIDVGLSYTANKAGKRTLAKVNVGVKQEEAKPEKEEKAAEKPAEKAKPKADAKKKNG